MMMFSHGPVSSSDMTINTHRYSMLLSLTLVGLFLMCKDKQLWSLDAAEDLQHCPIYGWRLWAHTTV